MSMEALDKALNLKAASRATNWLPRQAAHAGQAA